MTREERNARRQKKGKFKGKQGVRIRSKRKANQQLFQSYTGKKEKRESKREGGRRELFSTTRNFNDRYVEDWVGNSLEGEKQPALQGMRGGGGHKRGSGAQKRT